MHQLILIFHVLIAVSLIAIVLIQHGKGADMGASFGSGASQTVFGSQGSGSFLLRVTSIMAALFFATSLSLTYMASREAKHNQFMLPNSVTLPVSGKQPETQQQPVPLSLPTSQGSGKLPANQ